MSLRRLRQRLRQGSELLTELGEEAWAAHLSRLSDQLSETTARDEALRSMHRELFWGMGSLDDLAMGSGDERIATLVCDLFRELQLLEASPAQRIHWLCLEWRSGGVRGTRPGEFSVYTRWKLISGQWPELCEEGAASLIALAKSEAGFLGLEELTEAIRARTSGMATLEEAGLVVRSVSRGRPGFSLSEAARSFVTAENWDG